MSYIVHIWGISCKYLGVLLTNLFQGLFAVTDVLLTKLYPVTVVDIILT